VTAFLILLSSVFGSMAVAQFESDFDSIESISAALQNHMQVDQMHDAIRADVNAALLSLSNVTNISDVRQEFDGHTHELRLRMKENMQLPLNSTTHDALLAVGPPLEEYIHNADDIVRLIESGHSPSQTMLAAFKARFTALEHRMARVSDAVQQQVGLASHVSKANAAAINEILSVVATLSVAFLVIAVAFQTRPGKGFLTVLVTLFGAIAFGLRSRWRAMQR
jgi:methyl-accepting chemotaxis protein